MRAVVSVFKVSLILIVVLAKAVEAPLENLAVMAAIPIVIKKNMLAPIIALFLSISPLAIKVKKKTLLDHSKN